MCALHCRKSRRQIFSSRGPCSVLFVLLLLEVNLQFSERMHALSNPFHETASWTYAAEFIYQAYESAGLSGSSGKSFVPHHKSIYGPPLTICNYLNAHSDMSSRANGLNFGVCLQLPPYFVYASSEVQFPSALILGWCYTFLHTR